MGAGTVLSGASVIGTDPDEGIDTFDCYIIINTPTSSCIYCVWAPSACVGFPG